MCITCGKLVDHFGMTQKNCEKGEFPLEMVVGHSQLVKEKTKSGQVQSNMWYKGAIEPKGFNFNLFVYHHS